MAIVVASANTLSLTTGTKSAEQITGLNQFVGKGKLQIFAKASAAAATGIRMTASAGGVPLVDDSYVTFAGATGSLDVRANVMVDQMIAGGRLSLTFRNDSAGTLTVDYIVLFTPA